MVESGISIHLHMLYAMVVWIFYIEFQEKTREGIFISKVVAKGTCKCLLVTYAKFFCAVLLQNTSAQLSQKEKRSRLFQSIKKLNQISVISSKLAFSDHRYLLLLTIDNLIINLRVFIPQFKPELFPNFCLYQHEGSSKSTLHKSRIILLEKIRYTSKYTSVLFSQL